MSSTVIAKNCVELLCSLSMVINERRIFFPTVAHNYFRIMIDSNSRRDQLCTSVLEESIAEIKMAVKKASQSYGSMLYAGFSHRSGYNVPRR